MATKASKRPKTGGRKPGSVNRTTAEMRALAQQHAGLAIDTLVAAMKSATNPAVRVNAANSILDRAYGKPTQPLEAPQRPEPDPVTAGRPVQRTCPACNGVSLEQYQQALKTLLATY